MFGLKLDPTVRLGDLITILSVSMGALGLIVSWNKDRQLRRKEYSDKIRRAAGAIIAKLERWKEIHLRYFEGIQPVLTDADVRLVKERDATTTRDALWRELVALRSMTSKRILDEQIEVAYVDLYGYDPNVQELYAITVQRLKAIDEAAFTYLLQETQIDVLQLLGIESSAISATLGNELRSTAGHCHDIYFERSAVALADFRRELLKLIYASDVEITKKSISINAPKSVVSAGEVFASLEARPRPAAATIERRDARRRDRSLKSTADLERVLFQGVPETPEPMFEHDGYCIRGERLTSRTQTPSPNRKNKSTSKQDSGAVDAGHEEV